MAGPLPLILGDTLTVRAPFVDRVTGQPIAIQANNLTPGGAILLPAQRRTLPLPGALVTGADAGSGNLVDYVLLPDVQAPFAQVPLDGSSPPLVRLQAWLTDAAGHRVTGLLQDIQPLDRFTAAQTDLALQQVEIVVAAALNSYTLAEDTLHWIEFQGAAIQAGAPGLAGQSRPSGAQAGIAGPYASFEAVATCTVDGVLTVVNEDTPDLAYAMPVRGSVPPRPFALKVPAYGSAFHASFVASAVGSLSLVTAYTNRP